MYREGYIAFDFGASSGRMMFGWMQDNKIHLEELHRFENVPVLLGKTLYWDFLKLFHEMKQGLKIAATKAITIKGIAIDTWGVDIGWIDKQGQLIGNPIHYRDQRTTKIIDEVEEKISEESMYKITGIGKMPFNTIYQLYYDLHKKPCIQEYADSMLYMPDLFGYYLCGKKYNEYTIASTSGLLNAHTKTYEQGFFEQLNMHQHCLPKIVLPGTTVGKLTQEIQEETGLGAIPVIAVAGHDTACAVAAAPIRDDNTAFLICGTWSLMGMELTESITTEHARLAGFTNEGGVNGTVRFLKNINGLFFIQKLKKDFEQTDPQIGYPKISRLASQSNHQYMIDVRDQRFMNPLSMKKEIKKSVMQNYGVELTSIGDIARVAYNGLVKEYQRTLDELETITDKKVHTLCMVGGGIQDAFLCEHVTNTLGINVVKGPVEASVMGNILMQMQAVGEIKHIKQGRKLVTND